MLAALVDRPVGHLRASSGVAFAAGALLGTPGILGVALAGLLPLLVVEVPPYHPVLLAAVADLLVAAIAWLVMRFGGGVGRDLPDLASYAAACGAGIFGTLLSAPLLAAAAPQPTYAAALGTSATAGLSGIFLAGLPLLLVGAIAAPRLAAPIPGERRGGRPADLGRVAAGGDTSPAFGPESAPDGEATLFAKAPTPDRPNRGVLTGVAVLTGVGFAAVPVSVWTAEGDHWIALLYLLPVLWGARRFGLRGGVLAASLSGVVHLLGTGLLTLGLPAVADHPLSLYAHFLLLSPVGAYLGWAREEEVGLRRELASRNRLLRQDLLRVVRALTSAVEAKDAYTEAHLRRVADYAVAVGARLGVKGRDLETLYHAAMLHDVGKIGVPESVLSKPGPLDAEEAEAMRQHPEIGARIVERLDLLADAAPIILHHQERFDGGDGTYPGYPQRIAGEEIPLGSRIIAVVDAYDAMTSDRPYRDAKPAGEALAELRREAGRQFDPLVVEVFADVLAERPWDG